jgi:hypothetical protein
MFRPIPMPRNRAVMPCSHGTALTSRANSGTLKAWSPGFSATLISLF